MDSVRLWKVNLKDYEVAFVVAEDIQEAITKVRQARPGEVVIAVEDEGEVIV